MLADDHLDNFTLLQSSRTDEAREMVARIFCDHELACLDRSRRIRYRHWHTSLPSVGLSVMKYGANVRVQPREFGSFYLIQLPVAGHSAIYSNGSEYLTHAGCASVHAPYGKMSMQWSSDCQKTVVRIDRRMLERHLSSLLGHDVDAPIDFMPVMDTSSGMGATWMRSVLHLMNELQQNPLFAQSALIIAQFEQLLMTGLLQAQHSRYLDRLREPIRCLTPRHVRAAKEYIQANADKPISVEDLVRITGVSGRALYSGFQRFLGSSPMQYLRDTRMENARRDMENAPPSLTVTEIATKWGFYQLGRFATEYKARYGESPSATRQRDNT